MLHISATTSELALHPLVEMGVVKYVLLSHLLPLLNPIKIIFDVSDIPRKSLYLFTYDVLQGRRRLG